jgi:glycosyltransferase 2 family protein
LSIQDLQPRPRPYRRWLALTFSVAVTLGILVFVFRGIDRQIFAQLLSTQNPGLLALAAAFILLQIIFASERWRAILAAFLRGKAPAAAKILAVFYSSVFFNCLPVGTIGGDVARVWLSRKFELPISLIVLSVLVDRIITVGSLAILACCTLPVIGQPIAMTAWYVITAGLVYGIFGLLLLQPIMRVLGRWRQRRIVHLILRTAEELHHLIRRGGLTALLYALVSSLCSAVAVYCIARSLTIDVGLAPMIAITVIVNFIVALPISLAGWGVREISFVTMLGLLGVDRATALLLSIEFGILGTLMSLPGGAIWLTLGGQRRVEPLTK